MVDAVTDVREWDLLWMHGGTETAERARKYDTSAWRRDRSFILVRAFPDLRSLLATFLTRTSQFKVGRTEL